MSLRDALLEALREGGWKLESGRYIRGDCYVAFLSDTTVRYYDGGPVDEDDDTMRAVSGTMPIENAVTWVRRKNHSSPAG